MTRPARLEQVSVDGNEGTVLAGGLILWTRGDVALQGVEIRDNTSGEYGDGGLHFQPLEDALTLSATDSVVDGNQGGEAAVSVWPETACMARTALP